MAEQMTLWEVLAKAERDLTHDERNGRYPVGPGPVGDPRDGSGPVDAVPAEVREAVGRINATAQAFGAVAATRAALGELARAIRPQ